jgi:hypothetical protein
LDGVMFLVEPPNLVPPLGWRKKIRKQPPPPREEVERETIFQAEKKEAKNNVCAPAGLGNTSSRAIYNPWRQKRNHQSEATTYKTKQIL